MQSVPGGEAYPYAYRLSPDLAQGVPAGIHTLVLLLHPYAPWRAPIDAFYPASNRAYHRTKEFGVALPHVRLKPICNCLPMLTQGRNTLHYHAALGSRFVMTLHGFDEDAPECGEDARVTPKNRCAGCTRCMDACPTGAITVNGFDRAKCLRQHMLSGQPTPPDMREKMGERLLGCDICQRVCPMNAQVRDTQAPEALRMLFDVRSLLIGKTRMEQVAEVVGWNYANQNRWLAQAALAAGNSGDASLLPALEALIAHPSPAVREHAKWAKNRLSGIDSANAL